ncbi:ABC transporter substrate-binding protein, partial [Candidatus Pacearchaeota archaeon]|nr:ABC transporter substrate-binding protein [Candidatus Pacearchaeota archaeon]
MIFPYPDDSQMGQEFINKFEAEYENRPSLYAANSYDALMVIAKAIEEVGEDPLEVKEFLLDMDIFNGASGEFSFDQNGDIQKPVIIKQ